MSSPSPLYWTFWLKEVIGNLTSHIWDTPFTVPHGGGWLTGLIFFPPVSLALFLCSILDILLSSCPPWYCCFQVSALFLFSLYTLSFFFWLSCEILVSWPEIKLVSPAMQAQGLNHWTPRKSLHIPFLCDDSSDAGCHIYHLVCSVSSVMSDSWTVALQAPLSMEFSGQELLEWVAISFSRGSSQLRG